MLEISDYIFYMDTVVYIIQKCPASCHFQFFSTEKRAIHPLSGSNHSNYCTIAVGLSNVTGSKCIEPFRWSPMIIHSLKGGAGRNQGKTQTTKTGPGGVVDTQATKTQDIHTVNPCLDFPTVGVIQHMRITQMFQAPIAGAYVISWKKPPPKKFIPCQFIYIWHMDQSRQAFVSRGFGWNSVWTYPTKFHPLAAILHSHEIVRLNLSIEFAQLRPYSFGRFHVPLERHNTSKKEAKDLQ